MRLSHLDDTPTEVHVVHQATILGINNILHVILHNITKYKGDNKREERNSGGRDALIRFRRAWNTTKCNQKHAHSE